MVLGSSAVWHRQVSHQYNNGHVQDTGTEKDPLPAAFSTPLIPTRISTPVLIFRHEAQVK